MNKSSKALVGMAVGGPLRVNLEACKEPPPVSDPWEHLFKAM